MKYPNFREEKKLQKKGYRMVVGLDEAGRGSLAGPVVAAATLVAAAKTKDLLKTIKDSKRLAPKMREKIYQHLLKTREIEWGIGRVSEKVIDKINILEATKLAMKRAVKNLEKKIKKKLTQKSYDRKIFEAVDFLIIDGNFGINLNIPQKPIIKADEKVFSCVAASIIAKVTRDKIMIRYHKKYPKYGFDRHKGYPTELHRKMLKKYGPSVIHRLTFNH